ncbi:MAG: 3-oxoadipate enol-lactonase [Burkholderiales bacterium]
MTKTVKANGIETSYSLEGPADAPVLMLSNSLLTDYGMWDFQMPAFSAKYRVLRYDSRGHGGTQATPGAYTMELLVADVVGLLDALGIARVHFLGLSMGGMIGQLLAARHGDRLLSLCLSDTACQMPDAAAWDARIELARSKGTSAFVGPMTERWLTAGYRERHPEVLAKLAAMISRTAVDGLVGCANAIKTMDHLALLPGIKVPTQVIVGEHDVGTPVAAAQVLQREIPGAKLQVIKGAAHLPNVEQTAVFDATVLDFLSRH